MHPKQELIGLETGQLSNWLTRTLCELGLPVVCLDARHAKAALKLQVNKTDANDAWGLAQIVRTGWFREVAVKSMDAQALRMLLVARTHLISQRQATANVIRGLMKTFGLVIARGASGLFAPRVREAAAGNGTLLAIERLRCRTLVGSNLCKRCRGRARAGLSRVSRQRDRK